MKLRYWLTLMMLLGALVLTVSATVAPGPAQTVTVTSQPGTWFHGLLSSSFGQVTLAWFAPQKDQPKEEKKDPPPPKPPKPSKTKPDKDDDAGGMK